MKDPSKLRLDGNGPKTATCNNCKRLWSADRQADLDEFLFHIPNKRYAQVSYFLCPICRHLVKASTVDSMGKMSIEKGKTFEREVAKALSQWAGMELVRTPDGAPEAIYGDIWPKNTSELFALSVECKRGEDWSFDQIMASCGLFTSWAQQAYQQAYAASRSMGRMYMPALIFRRSRQPSMIALGYLLDDYVTQEYIMKVSIYKQSSLLLAPVAIQQVAEIGRSGGFEYHGPVHSMYAVMLLNQFLESYSYPQLLEHILHSYDI